MDPVSSGNPVHDIAPRAAVTLRPLVTYLIVEVTHRRVLTRYRRDPGSPVPPAPSVIGEFRSWERTHFRLMSLPLFFRVPEDQFTSGGEPRRPLTWIGRRSDRQREIIREELAARGYPLPE